MVETGRALLSRRQVLAGTALSLVGGCGPRVSRYAPRNAGSIKIGNALPVPQALRSVLTSHLRVAGTNLEMVWPDEAGWTDVGWLLTSGLSGGQYPRGSAVDLTNAFKNINFNPDVLLPGFWAASQRGGGQYAVPVSFFPVVLYWRKDIWEQLGLTPPGPSWTIDRLMEDAASVERAIAAGNLRKLGVDLTFSPLLGSARLAQQIWVGAVDYYDLWMAFISGYGGQLIVNGQFNLTGGKTVEGISTLSLIIARYGSSPPPATQAAADVLAKRCAMSFAFNGFGEAGAQGVPTTEVPPKQATPARFPVLPVRAVQPVLGRWQSLVRIQPGRPREYVAPGTVPDTVLEAVGRYFDWWYGGAQQALLAASGVGPVRTAASVQKQYWQKYGMDVAADDILEVSSMLPRGVAPGKGLDETLERAATDPGSITSGLQAVAAKMNAELASVNATLQ